MHLIRWWEGILLELNDIDESKATVYFPGENDTQTVKIWDLRPSLQWEDGKWVSWVNSTALEVPIFYNIPHVDDNFLSSGFLIQSFEFFDHISVL